MKGKHGLIAAVVAGVAAAGIFAACGKTPARPTFDAPEYEITSGQAIGAAGATGYRFVGSVPAGVTLDPVNGVISFGDDVPDRTQVMVAAVNKGGAGQPVVVSLISQTRTPTLAVTNLSDYLLDGENVHALATPAYAVTYRLVGEVAGITVDAVSGKVTFGRAVADGARFTVRAECKGVTAEKEFIAAKANFVSCAEPEAICEAGQNAPLAFRLDFTAAPEALDGGVLGVMYRNEIVPDAVVYDAATRTATLDGAFTAGLPAGENRIKLITAKNTVTVTVRAATKLIATAEDLAAIGTSLQALSGYYVQVEDIDLTSYLAPGGAGYDYGSGWSPIGLYYDVTDGTATEWAFKGAYDGNGHTIEGYYINRDDTKGYNAGLFGYVDAAAVIRNVSLKGADASHTRSFAGGFVGVNAGTIENCRADVDISAASGENLFHAVGGFAGRNAGVIRDCISLGSANSDYDYGIFVGWNEGEIDNCFAVRHASGAQAFHGRGYAAENSVLFESESAMAAYDFSQRLGADWNIAAGKIPTLAAGAAEQCVRGISITNTTTEYLIGQQIDIAAAIAPAALAARYADSIEYEVIGEGIRFRPETHTVITTQAETDRFTVRITLATDYGTFTATKEFRLYDGTEHIAFAPETETTMYAGKRYRVSASVQPETARPDVTYSVAGGDRGGVSVSGDVVTIAEDATLAEFDLVAEAGGKTATHRVRVITITALDLGLETLFEGQTEGATFDLSALEEDFGTLRVRRFGNEVPFTVAGQAVSIPAECFTEFPDRVMNVYFEFGAKGAEHIYRANAIALSRREYTEAYLRAQYPDLIEIASVEDFLNCFNCDADTYDEMKYDNYGKTFILTADLDFGGRTLYGIGFDKEYDVTAGGTSTTVSVDHLFRGNFFGLGHTLSNFTIKHSEYELYMNRHPEAPQGSSSSYGVGLFAKTAGRIADLNIANAKVSANNFVGVIAGLNEGIVDNCHIVNSTASADGKTSSTGDYRVAGVAGKSSGKVTACSYNGGIANLVG